MKESIRTNDLPQHPGNSLPEFLRIMRSGNWLAPKSKDLKSIRAFIHGYLQGLFQNEIAEISFPKFRWFDTWIKGRIIVEEPTHDGWPEYITHSCNNKDAIEHFFRYYEEFASAGG